MSERSSHESGLVGQLDTYKKNESGIYLKSQTAEIKPGEVVVFSRGFEPKHTDLKGMPSLVKEAKEKSAFESLVYFSKENEGIFLSPAKGQSLTVVLDPNYDLQSNYVSGETIYGDEILLIGYISKNKSLIKRQAKYWENLLPRNPTAGFREL